MVNICSLERDGLRQAELCPRYTVMNNINNTLLPDRSKPGITMTTPTVGLWDAGDKYATGVQKIKTRMVVQGQLFEAAVCFCGI